MKLKIYDDRTQFYQYDSNQKLVIEDGEEVTELHFTNNTMSTAYVVECYEEDGIKLCNIPNVMLTTNGIMIVYAFVNDSSEYTKRSFAFDVVKRKKPDDYVEEETIVKWSTLEARIETLENSDDDFVTTEELQEALENSNSVEYDINMKSICHRGYIDAPENTIPAYLLAKEKGFKYVECDVALTSDKVPVLLHDTTIDRTSNGTGNVYDFTYNELLALDFGSYKNEAYTGVQIPSFDEFMKYCKYLGLHPYIELKYCSNIEESDIQNIVDIVNRNGMKGKVTYISFNVTYLEYLKNYDDSARIGYVVTTVTDESITWADSFKTENNEVFIDSNEITDDIVELCIANGYELETWTVDDEETIKNLNAYVSGVTSDNLIASKILHDKYSEYVNVEPVEPEEEETEEPTGWQLLKEIGDDELVEGALYVTPPDYIIANEKRLSYNKFDMFIEYGYSYKIEYECDSYTHHVQARIINETAYNLVLESKQYGWNDYASSGVGMGSLEFTPTETVNDSPIKVMQLIFKKSDETGEVAISIGDITNIKVYKMKVE